MRSLLLCFVLLAGCAPSPTEPVVDRSALGGCPRGYVDHPADASKCVLPVVAERILARAARRANRR